MQRNMRNLLCTATLLVFLGGIAFGQKPELTAHLLAPRLDTTFWEKDYDQLNANYSKAANQCQTCVFSESDTTRSRFCLNTSTGHVRLDTVLHNVTPEKLTGEWRVVNLGVFETTDSLPPNGDRFIRTQRIVEQFPIARGKMVFTNKVVRLEIQAGDKRQRKRNSYVILECRYLMTRKLVGLCGPTMVGLTPEGLLILDMHSYRTLAGKGSYLVVRTSINRTILAR